MLNWYDIPKEDRKKKADKVARWREILANNTALPLLREWTAEDEEELVRITNREIDMSETYLGRYAALQKRNAVAAVLDFSTKEWESLKALREAEDARETAETAMADENNNNDGTLEAVNGMIGGVIDEGAA